MAEFHYLHNAPDGAPYADPAETVAAHRWPRRERRGIGLTLLPVLYAHGGFGGAPPTEGQRRFVIGLDAIAAAVRDAARGTRPRMSASRRTACAR